LNSNRSISVGLFTLENLHRFAEEPGTPAESNDLVNDPGQTRELDGVGLLYDWPNDLIPLRNPHDILTLIS
jgi:hypothetical protein